MSKATYLFLAVLGVLLMIAIVGLVALSSNEWIVASSKFVLGLIGIVMGAWFLHAFVLTALCTGPDDPLHANPVAPAVTSKPAPATATLTPPPGAAAPVGVAAPAPAAAKPAQAAAANTANVAMPLAAHAGAQPGPEHTDGYSKFRHVAAADHEALIGMFTFAYAFTLLALGLVMLPFATLPREGTLPDSGPIRLLRGCVVQAPKAQRQGQAGTSAEAGSSSAANEVHHERVATSKMQPKQVAKARHPDQGRQASSTASAAPSEMSSSPAASSTASSSSSPASSSEETGLASAQADTPVWPKGLPVCGADPADVYTVLLSIGGVIAQSRPAPVVSKAGEGVTVAAPGTVYIVRDGFVVPLMIAVLALVGGTINLFRRLPEYQKRSHACFKGSPGVTPLLPCEAREFVVFQILQLVSAPFIAMVAYYAIAPQSMSSAVTLAVSSGLFSEAVLLRLRLLVEGPGKSPTEANP